MYSVKPALVHAHLESGAPCGPVPCSFFYLSKSGFESARVVATIGKTHISGSRRQFLNRCFTTEIMPRYLEENFRNTSFLNKKCHESKGNRFA